MTIPQTSYCLIALTQNKWTIVDADLYVWLSQWKWHAHWDLVTRNFYARRAVTHADGSRGAVSMQRQIIGLERFDPMTADHINGDSLDNRRSNLRVATVAQQQMNRGVRIDNKTGIKGVCVRSSSGKYVVQLRKQGKCLFRAEYETIEEAARMYEQKQKEHHGEYASSTRGNRWNHGIQKG